MNGKGNWIKTVKVTFRLRPGTFEKICKIVADKPRLWRSRQTVSSYIYHLISADLKRREEKQAAAAPDKPQAKRRTNGSTAKRVRQK